MKYLSFISLYPLVVLNKINRHLKIKYYMLKHLYIFYVKIYERYYINPIKNIHTIFICKIGYIYLIDLIRDIHFSFHISFDK